MTNKNHINYDTWLTLLSCYFYDMLANDVEMAEMAREAYNQGLTAEEFAATIKYIKKDTRGK